MSPNNFGFSAHNNDDDDNDDDNRRNNDNQDNHNPFGFFSFGGPGFGGGFGSSYGSSRRRANMPEKGANIREGRPVPVATVLVD